MWIKLGKTIINADKVLRIYKKSDLEIMIDFESVGNSCFVSDTKEDCDRVFNELWELVQKNG